MKRFLGAWLAMALISGLGSTTRADEKDATPILDKAIKALGGEEKLAKASKASWKSKGTIVFNDNENPVKTQVVIDGLDRARSDIDLEINGMPIKGITVLNGSKSWRKFGEETQELDEDGLAAAKQNAYLQIIAATILPVKGKGFKVEAAGEGKADGKTTALVKGTGPDGKTFTLAFDKETGLLAKLTSVVKSPGGEEVEQEWLFTDYKDFDGLKRATKTEIKRDGNPFLKMDTTDFKVLDKVEADTFAEPK